MPSAATVSQLAKVLVEDSDFDLPSPADPHVRDRVVDDELSERGPRHSDVLGGLLAGEPD